MKSLKEEALVQKKEKDRFIGFLKRVLALGVKILALLIIPVVFLAIADTTVHLYQLLTSGTDPFNVERLIDTLGSFLAVLIVIEVFLNIVFFLKENAVHVPLVLSTALTAVRGRSSFSIIPQKTLTTYMHQELSSLA